MPVGEGPSHLGRSRRPFPPLTGLRGRRHGMWTAKGPGDRQTHQHPLPRGHRVATAWTYLFTPQRRAIVSRRSRSRCAATGWARSRAIPARAVTWRTSCRVVASRPGTAWRRRAVTYRETLIWSRRSRRARVSTCGSSSLAWSRACSSASQGRGGAGAQARPVSRAASYMSATRLRATSGAPSEAASRAFSSIARRSARTWGSSPVRASR